MFKVKDEVVYPGHGVAVIQEAIVRNVGQETQTFFKLSFKYKDMSILVPQSRMVGSGIRFVSEKKDVDGMFFELMAEPDAKKLLRENVAAGWSKRQRDYQAKIDSGAFLELARAYRDLKRFSESKPLSFGEKGILYAAEELLSQEVAEATREDRGDVLRKLRLPFEKPLVQSSL